MRTFLIPVGEITVSGRSTKGPLYVLDLGLRPAFSGGAVTPISVDDLAMMSFDAADEVLNQLSASKGVVEIKSDAAQMSEKDKASLSVAFAGKLAVPEAPTGLEAVKEIRLTMMAKQIINGLKGDAGELAGIASRIQAQLAVKV